MNEEPGLARSRSDAPARVRARLQGAHHRRSHGPDAPPGAAVRVDRLGGFLGQSIRLTVHDMLGETVRLNGLARARADVQVQLGHGDALVTQPSEYRRGEVQTRRGGRYAPVVRRVYGLIRLAILRAWRPANVGRERHFTVLRERALGVERAAEPHPPHAAAQHLEDLDGTVGAEPHGPSGLELSPGVAHCEPRTVGQLADEQKLRVTTGVAFPVQSRRDHPRRVEDQDVARCYEVDEFVKARVADGAARSLQHQEPTGRAVGEWLLSDEFARE